MPTASVRTTVAVKPGVLRIVRRAYWRSRRTAWKKGLGVIFTAPFLQCVVRPGRGAGDASRRRLRREILSRIDEPIALEAILLVVELPIPAAAIEQLVVRASFDDLAVLQDEDLIG